MRLGEIFSIALMILALLSVLVSFSAFLAVSEGVYCVGYCYGESKFNVHYRRGLNE